MLNKRKKIKQSRLKELIDIKFEGKQVLFAEKTGITANLVSRYVRGVKGIGEDMQDRIEDKCGLPINWLDGVDEAKTYRNTPLKNGYIRFDISCLSKLIIRSPHPRAFLRPSKA